MTFSRKEFIAATAIAASAAAVGEPSIPAAAQERASIHFSVLKPGQFDGAAMLRKLSTDAEHKQVFQSVDPLIVAPGIASVYLHMQNAMNAYEFSLGLGRLSTLAVFIGLSIVLSLDDATWKKYGLGRLSSHFQLAQTNAYYPAGSTLDLDADPDDPKGVYQDWSAQAVLKRGGQFFVCHNAATGIAFLVAQKLGANPRAVLADFESHLLPGFAMVPAGVAAVQQAQEHGWKPFAIL